jgi:hypothetical protein
MLRDVSMTAAGHDRLPHWLSHNCAIELSDVITFVITSVISKLSSNEHCPAACKNSVVPHVPKVSMPIECSADFVHSI